MFATLRQTFNRSCAVLSSSFVRPTVVNRLKFAAVATAATVGGVVFCEEVVTPPEELTPDVDELFKRINGDQRDGVMAFLTTHSDLLEARDLMGRTPMMAAAMRGERDLVGFILARGASANAIDMHGLTALEYACWRGHLNIVNCLLDERSTKANTVDVFGLSPLHKAVAFGHEAIVKALLKRRVTSVDINKRTGEVTAPPSYEAETRNETALHISVHHNNFSMTKLLLSLKANPNIKNKFGQTPLHQAWQEADYKVIGVLLDNGADENIKDNEGKVPGEDIPIIRKIQLTPMIFFFRQFNLQF